MSCLAAERLVELLDLGGLDAAAEGERRHLADCAACRTEWGSVAGAGDFLAAAKPAAARPAGRWLALAAAAALLAGLVGWSLRKDPVVLPAASPSGRGPAAIALSIGVETKEGNQESHVGVLQDGKLADLGPGHSPCWAPDGSRLAFVSEADGNPEIWSMKPDGTDRKRLTKNRGRDLLPRWSPDGRTIAFSSDRDGNYEIYLMDADGANARPITRNDVADYGADWSPDGKRLVFASQRDGNDEIYAMNSDGSNPVRLTRCPVFDTLPRWSPDGKRILFLSTRARGVEGGLSSDFDAHAMDADGSNPDRITTSTDLEAAGWNADGSGLVLVRPGAERHAAWTSDAEGGNAKELAGFVADDAGFHLDSSRGWRLQGLEYLRAAPAAR